MLWNCKKITPCLCLIVLFVIAPLLLRGAPKVQSGPQWQRPISCLQNDVRNLEDELDQMKARLANQETVLDDLRDQVGDQTDSSRELVKLNVQSVDGKLEGFDASLKGVVEDFKQFRTQANEVASQLNQQKKRLDELERLLKAQKQDIGSLQSAINSILEALGVPRYVSQGVYEIKSGDSLGKIAIQNKTTIAELRRLNQLKNDRIFPGQKLLLPQK